VDAGGEAQVTSNKRGMTSDVAVVWVTDVLGNGDETDR
jgi:hypothetical protein